jgi:hypothetical protein
MAILIQGTKPFKIRMTCGHLEIRMMREELAGVEYSPDVILEAQYSGCAECEITKISCREMQRDLNRKYGLERT